MGKHSLVSQDLDAVGDGLPVSLRSESQTASRRPLPAISSARHEA